MTSVKVAVRVRPLNRREVDLESGFIIQMHGKKTTIVNNKIGEGAAGVADAARDAMRLKDFTFDFSFWSVDREDKETYHDQATVYQCLGQDVVQSGFEGYNACVFAYGQTGSGKTYTMMGSPDDRGLIPRICEDLFSKMTDETTSYRTEVSYLEIYNEKVRDLLKTSGSGSQTHSLRVREHPKDGPYVQGLSKYIVHNYPDIETLMQRGNSVRTTASTNMNDTSSRSHAIFTVVFTQATIRDGIPSEKTSKIHLVDLAGSERATATGATGVRLREGGSINKSLVSLGTVIKQLAELSEKGSGGKGKASFIPYRDSVLTWLLKDSLGGNSRTIMVTTISPAEVNYAETLSALRYANRAKNIINKPTVNEDLNVKLIRELKAEIERLKTMIGGDIDNISAPKMKERLHESEARMKVLTEEWSEKWKDIASILKEQGTLALRKEGLGVVLDSTLPHLIGIDDDILSTGIMLFHLKEGMTRIGRSDADPPVDIVITGQEVETDHCTIENNNSTVTLIPGDDALCSVNGNMVSKPTKLTQGAVVLLGKTNMFRYNNPAEAAEMKKELQKSGMTFSLSRTSLISQSMTDLYRSSDNISHSNSWEMDQSHREEQERIEELRGEIRTLEDRYHAEEEERLNQQVAMEMELEKKQRQLEKTSRDLHTLQQQAVEAHQHDGVLKRLPKGAQIDALLQELEEREKTLNEKTRQTRDSLMERLESITSENEEEKAETSQRVVVLDDQLLEKEKQQAQLDQQLAERKQTAQEQDAEDQKVIDTEQQQLEQLQGEFDTLFYEAADSDESLKQGLQEVAVAQEKMDADFEKVELEMREKWKRDVDLIAEENKEIEEAWNDLREQEHEHDELLASDKVSEKEKADIEIEKEQLKEAKTLLKIEEEKVAAKERKILDGIEVEMDEWEKQKRSERKEIATKKASLAKETGNTDLIQLNLKIEEKEVAIADLLSEFHKQDHELKEYERGVEEKKHKLLEEKEEIQRDKAVQTDRQSKTMIRLQEEIISINEELNKLDTTVAEELKDIQEERESLLLLKKSQRLSPVEGGLDNLGEKLQDLPLTEEEQRTIGSKQKEVEELQGCVEKTSQQLDDVVSKFDQARDYELDMIELEKVNLQDRVRQDRINALVEQEVKRRMFEEKCEREQRRQLERDKERREREEEIQRLKDAHHREIKQLKAKYERRTGSKTSMAPSQSNPYVTVMSADSDGDVPRRKSTGSVSRSLEAELPPTILLSIPYYRLQNYGSDSHYEYEVKIVIGDDVWSIMRRYSKFRELHQGLKNKIPEIGALVFPPKKLFSKNEKVASERRQQLEFYMRSVIEICSKVPSCPLHRNKNKFLDKQILCDFDPFFRKGLFENSKYGTT